MKSFLYRHLIISLNALFLVGVLVCMAWYIDNSQGVFEHKLLENISRQTETITELAQITDRNGADEIIERIVSDCPRRAEFENLLERLNALSPKDLIATQQLFESCGNFYAERKALMVSRLEREYAVLVDSTELLETLHDLSPEIQQTLKWKDLIELEGNRSSILTDQTNMQAEIIALLIGGGKNEYKQVAVLLKEAQEVGQSLSVLDKQIDDLRSSLMH